MSRARILPIVLEQQGIEPRRFKLEWVSSAEASRFAEVVSQFTEDIRALGPNPLRQQKSQAA